MNSFLSYCILIASLIGIVILLKGFTYRQIFTLIFWGGLLLILLQMIYISFGKDFTINLIFIKWNVEVSNYIQNVVDYFDNTGVYPGWMRYIIIFLSLIIPATLEEVGKFYVFKWIASSLWVLKGITSSVFAIVYVAIGFSFFETGFYIYFLSTQNQVDNLMVITVTRIFISTLSHIFFSAIIGYYFWKAFFMEFDLIDNLEIGKTTKLIKKLKYIPFINIHTISRYYFFKYIITGFSLAIILHSMYNLFMSTGNVLFGIFTVLIGLVLIIRVVLIKKPNENYQNIKSKILYIRQIRDLKEKIKHTDTLFQKNNTIN